MQKRYRQKNVTSYNYRDVIWRLAVTDFKLKYQGSIFGYLWSLVKPLFLFTILYLVFSRFAAFGSTPNYPLYLLIGIVVWSFFIDITLVALNSVSGRADLIRKVYFPRIVLPLSASITSLLTFALNFIVVIIFAIYTNAEISWHIALLPLYLIEIYVFALGVSLFLASLNVRFKDIAHIWEVVINAAFYLTPILYPLSIIPQQYIKIALLSPVAHFIQSIRDVFIPQASSMYSLTGPYVTAIAWLLPFVILGLGLLYFNKVSDTFPEKV